MMTETEESIFEYTPNTEDEVEEQTGLILDGKQMSYVGGGLKEIPTYLGEQYGPFIENLDLSNNEIKSIANLSQFSKLKTLVLDNNLIESKQKLPKLTTLHTLCVNSNNIDDIEIFLNEVKKQFPNVSYLSLLKNPDCPNFFTGKDQQDYQRYRYFVLHKMPNLKFLDSSPVTPTELKEAKRVGQFMRVARPTTDQYKKIEHKDADFASLPQDLREPGKGDATFNRSKYVTN
eukprot:TRINITY_DN1368_c0_g1_i2.p1 TRINITY_DN1368_c0_g1~~TRINITY_DN1368_c0_g1_i2.p1  ORF type:complete len:232 (-),score=27.30 TRINITY_DN1368_c0_g1_i2:218-913(-)